MIQSYKQDNLSGRRVIPRDVCTQREGRANVYQAGLCVVCLIQGRRPHVALSHFVGQRGVG